MVERRKSAVDRLASFGVSSGKFRYNSLQDVMGRDDHGRSFVLVVVVINIVDGLKGQLAIVDCVHVVGGDGFAGLRVYARLNGLNVVKGLQGGVSHCKP
jgi:hypothetical protein